MRFALILLLLTWTTSAFAKRELVDRIVAIVDGFPVLHSEVIKKVELGPLITVSDFPAKESDPEYMRALQDAVNFELILQQARELEIDMDDADVDADIERFLDRQGRTKDDLLMHLNSQGQTYEQYRDDYRDMAIFRRFQGRVITPQVKITDKDIETYYLKKTGSTADLVELQLRQILIKVDPSATDEIVTAKRNLAQEVHGKLEDGANFEEMVKIYSDDASARTSGGLMTGIRLKDLAGTIRSEVESLEVEQFTIPVRTQLGFHIFYLEEKNFSGSQDFLSQKQRLEFELRNLEIRNQTREWLADQRQRTKTELILD